jgi:uncharacterized protein YraI
VTTSVRDAIARHPFAGTPRSPERGRALYRSVAFLTVFAMLFGGLLLLTPAGVGAQSTATTTDYLNLRQGPSTGTAIVTTMPAGATVTVNGSPEGAFYPVSYNGMSGYAHGDWLSIGGGGSAPPVSGGGPTGNATVTSALNLRSGPSTGNSVLTVMPAGASVTLTGESSGGFYGVVYNGISGFAHSDWISAGGSAPAPAPSNPGSGSAPVGDTAVGSATVTAYALNVRSGPSTGYSIVSTVTSGQVIDIMGDPQGGFYPMRAGGVKGWVSGDYISMGGTAAPAPTEPAPAPAPSNPGSGSGSVPVGDTVVNTAVVTAGALNMRSGPSTSYPVILGMSYGEQVEIMGDPQGGFYPVRYLGSKGWASGDYLNIGGTATPPRPGDGTYSQQEIIDIIYAAADRYGQPRADMLRVARCESVLDPNAVNPYSNASGLFQFLPSTWATTPYANENIFDPVANANAAGWMWSVGRRNEWVCQ